MAYRVKLKNFNGPLDLLLFLIKKNEVDIYDIPIAEITRQYLEYVEIIKLLDLEGAGEFILLAATLIRIKAKMRLPHPVFDEEEETIDPRMELVSRLLEYKRYKEVSFKFANLEERRRKLFNRNYFTEKDRDYNDEIALGEDVTLFSLIATFKQVIDKMPKETYHEIEDFKISLDEQIRYILDNLNVGKKLSFFDLISHLTDRIIVVVTFMALLELIKQGEVVTRQSIPFGENCIARRRD